MTAWDSDDDLSALDGRLDDAGRMAAAFSAELGRMQGALADTQRGLGQVERGFAGGVRRAIDGVVLDGAKLSDALAGLGRSMIDAVYAAAVKPVTDQLGAALARGLGQAVAGLAPFAQGGAFSQGRVMPFAKGGVVASATPFAMRGGSGLMGEAGPEAIMPLARDASGRLGVRAGGAAPAPQVTINIATPDVAGFARSQSQIAAELARLLGRASRNR